MWVSDTTTAPELLWTWMFPPTVLSPHDPFRVVVPELLWMSRFPPIVVPQIELVPELFWISTLPSIVAFVAVKLPFDLTLTFPVTCVPFRTHPGPALTFPLIVTAPWGPVQLVVPPAATGAPNRRAAPASAAVHARTVL